MTERSERQARTDRAPETGPGPVSDVARGRLGAELSSEVAATRAAWADATLRSDAALRHGRPEEARAALDDQRRLLTQLQQRLDRAVISALVEREAEQVVSSAAATAMAAEGEPDDGSGAGEDLSLAPVEMTDGAGAGRPRLLTGLVSAVAVGVVALAITAAPPPTPEVTAIADPPVIDPEPEPDPLTEAGGEPTTSPPPADELRGLDPAAPSRDVGDPDAGPDAGSDAEPEPAPPEPADEASEGDAGATDAEESGSSDGAVDEEGDATPRSEREGDDRDEAADDDATDDDATEEAEDVDDLRERLPSLDGETSSDLEDHLRGLLEP